MEIRKRKSLTQTTRYNNNDKTTTKNHRGFLNKKKGTENRGKGGPGKGGPEEGGYL